MGQGRSCPSSDTLKCPETESAVIFNGQKTGLKLRLKVSCHTLQSSSKWLFRATGKGVPRGKGVRGGGTPTMPSHFHLVLNWKYYSPAGPSPFFPTLISNNTWLFPEFKSTPKRYEFASGERLLRAYTAGFKGDPQRGMARNDPATAAASAPRIACASIDGVSV